MLLFLSLKLGLGTDQMPLYQISMHELINGAKILSLFSIIALILVNSFIPANLCKSTNAFARLWQIYELGRVTKFVAMPP